MEEELEKSDFFLESDILYSFPPYHVVVGNAEYHVVNFETGITEFSNAILPECAHRAKFLAAKLKELDDHIEDWGNEAAPKLPGET